jgi:DNA-binding CsgD family transcriptional regulator
MPVSKHLLPDLEAGLGVTLPGTSKDGLRVSLINHLAVASKFCVSGLLRRANLSESTSTFLGVFSILPLRSCSIYLYKRGRWTPGHQGFLTLACRGGMNQLTHKEQKIVALVAQGLTNKEIAQRLGSSPLTVRNQVKVIIRKLELKNRVQVAYLFGQQVNIDEIAV